ncbi:extracellular solute-binding protein [Paenibacillus allorhizosphaerae]|uniref:HTH gntR-type domain-containing protein n=1 Tax=Paenibacillus allorhizosphaerae TaxID=2849866 RepID=A0ABN7TND8_9BACL|nr:extracellular solute-binding protein [Paenibacillus allorhizosphaerae]CAG7643230.1 hypothetical protein PAECIP111802_02975 [Paenibacillus allorhizosphaerae]
MTNPSGRTKFRVKLEQFIQSIRSDILSGKRQVGDFLPSEKALSGQFGLSNNSIRKGLDVLLAEGLIEKIPKVGNKIVTPPGNTEFTIRFGYHPTVLEEAALHLLLNDFHDQFPHIQVVPVPIQNNSIDEYIKAGLLDAVTLNYNNFRSFMEADLLDMLEPQEPSPQIYPYLNKAFSSDGELLVQPFIFSPLVICYNKKHFTEAGLLEPDSSWTWGDLIDNALKLSEKNDGLGFYVHLFSNNRWPVFLLQSGYRFQKGENGRYQVTGTSCIEGLRVCKDLLQQFKIPPIFENEAEAEKLFLEEHVSIIMTNYFRLNRLSGASFPYDIAPIPYLNQARTLMLTIGLALCSNSKKKEAAQILIDYLISYRAQLLIRQHTLSVPSLKTAAEWVGKESMYRPSRFHLYREIAPTFSLYTDLNLKESQLNAALREAKLYWSGLSSEQTVCSRLEEILN